MRICQQFSAMGSWSFAYRIEIRLNCPEMEQLVKEVIIQGDATHFSSLLLDRTTGLAVRPNIPGTESQPDLCRVG
jgi:hypothetical protein